MKAFPFFALGAALATLVLSGCGKSGVSPQSAATPTPAASASPTPDQSAGMQASPAPSPETEKQPDTGEPKELNIFCWTGYIPQSVIDRFTRQTGIQVHVENYASNKELLQKLASANGKYDLIQPGEYVTDALIHTGSLLQLDHQLIPNLANLAPEFQHLPFDPNHDYSIPWMAGTVGIVVNTAMVPDSIAGYKDVFQDKYKDSIVVLDDPREIVSWGLCAMHTPVNNVSDDNLVRVRPLLAQWLPLVKAYSSNPKTELASGDAAIGIMWSGDAATLLNSDKNFRWVLPAEGAHLFVDNLAIPKDAGHPKNAELFMDFVLRPKVSILISEDFPYLNPNEAARKLLQPAQLANPASYPRPGEMQRLQTFRDIGDDQQAKIEDLITTLKVQ
ncbi:MAG TPA: spermidine/putrescine ABC transporter substrate-binding protein [Chthoniobacterales bacterium]